MVRKILCMLVLLLVVASVSAATTEIIVETYADHDITIFVMNSGEEDVVETFEENSGSTGRLAFSFSTSESKIDISAIARKDGKIIVLERFDGEATGGQINIELLKDEDKEQEIEETVNDTEEIVNETVNETEVGTAEKTLEEEPTGVEETGEVVEEIETINATEEVEGVTGASVLENKIPKNVYLIITVIFVLGAIMFFLVKTKVLKRPGKVKNIKIRKYSEIKGVGSTDAGRLEELEKKMQGIKEEIEEIKNKKSKIQEVEERLKNDMAELERLKGGES